MRKQRSTRRSGPQPDFQPQGWPTVTPRLVVADPAGLVGFLKTVFAATGDPCVDRPATIRIGDSIVMVSDGGGLRDPNPGFLYVYVPDIDATYERAIAARAVAVERPANLPYGDRRAMFRDPWGNLWQVATRRSGSTEPEADI